MLLTSMSSATVVMPCLFNSAVECCQMTVLLYAHTWNRRIMHCRVPLTHRHMLVPDYHHSELSLEHLLERLW